MATVEIDWPKATFELVREEDADKESRTPFDTCQLIAVPQQGDVVWAWPIVSGVPMQVAFEVVRREFTHDRDGATLIVREKRTGRRRSEPPARPQT